MVDGFFSIELPVDTVVTLSTLTGQKKGSFGTIPPSELFPVPYFDTFDGEKYFRGSVKAPFLVIKQPININNNYLTSRQWHGSEQYFSDFKVHRNKVEQSTSVNFPQSVILKSLCVCILTHWRTGYFEGWKSSWSGDCCALPHYSRK